MGKKEKDDDIAKKKDKKKLEKEPVEALVYCTTAASAEQARAHDDDEPCDDSREGKVDSRDIDPLKKVGKKMHNKKELCKKIREIYPEIGECGINIDADWDEDKNAWIVDLKSKGHELTTYIEPEDANGCMDGKQCVSLGLQIAQLKANIETA